MKKMQIGLGLLTAALTATAAAQVSVNVGAPGLYGHVDIGGYASPPPVLYRQPVYAERLDPRAVAPPPVYLHVPPGQERHWRAHCREYDACGRPVYFVQHDWYRNVYSHRGDGDRRGDDRHDDRGDHRGNDGHDDRGDHRDDHRDGGRGDDHRDGGRGDNHR